MTIPYEAVAEAARIIYRISGRKRVMSFEDARENCEIEARDLLEAAAPHLMAGVTALADNWEAQGEFDMAYSKTVADEDIAIQLLQAGAQMVDDARLVRNAIGAAK